MSRKTWAEWTTDNTMEVSLIDYELCISIPDDNVDGLTLACDANQIDELIRLLKTAKNHLKDDR